MASFFYSNAGADCVIIESAKTHEYTPTPDQGDGTLKLTVSGDESD